MREALVIRNYAVKTVSTYVSELKRYLMQLTIPVERVTPDDVQSWQFYLAHEKKISWTLFNQIVCALRFYFAHVATHHLQLVRNPLNNLCGSTQVKKWVACNYQLKSRHDIGYNISLSAINIFRGWTDKSDLSCEISATVWLERMSADHQYYILKTSDDTHIESASASRAA